MRASRLLGTLAVALLASTAPARPVEGVLTDGGASGGTIGAEIGLDANPNDSDGDGLDDDVEANLGTDPNDPDSDGDGVCDGGGTGGGACAAGPDNCPFIPNQAQANSDSLFAGDVCQCGDLDLDGGVDADDVMIARQHLVGATIVVPYDLTRCNVIGPSDGGITDCDVADVYVLERVVAGRPTAVENACQAYDTLRVRVDIKPGSESNSVNPFSRGVVPVAILSSEEFDATAVDADSVRFGPVEAEKKHKSAHVKDVDHDGDLDLIFHFRTRDTGLAPGDTTACLRGQTDNGVLFEGCDAVRTVPPLL
jgi:hypothetical protein